jgi:hypothetical protein
MRRWSRWIGKGLLIGLVALGACAGDGDEPVAEVRWDETAPASGRVVDDAVEVTGVEGGATFPLVTLDAAGVGDVGYAIVGDVRYEDIAEAGYLEMWTVFPDGSRYFSRTLADHGAMAALAGDSDWRPFQLPFSLEGATQAPSTLELNAVLPSTGRVWIGPVRLVAVDDAAAAGAWWTDRTAGLVFGIGGAMIGVLGAMIGSFAARGKARQLVIGTMAALGALGVVSLVAGVVAVFDSQPYAVTGPLFLSGGILVVLMVVLMPNVKRQYAQVELRKMRALDAA